MSKVAQCDSNGFFVGCDDDYGGPMPYNCFSDIPEIRDGYIPKRIGNGWEYIEDHRGKSGFVDGRYVTIKEPGPLPNGWSAKFVDLRTPMEIRATQIAMQLNAIDRKRVRPVARILLDGDAEDDKRILSELEAEAVKLRAELASLTKDDANE